MKYFLTLLFFLIPLVWSTRVNANYVTAKTFLLFLVSSLALFALPEQLKLREVPRALLWLGGLLIGYQVVYYALDPSYFNLLYSFKTLSFLFLVLYFYTLDLSVEEFLRKNTLLIGLMFGFIFVVTFRQIAMRFQGGDEIIYGGILSTFGNVNMFSEFMVLALPFLFLWQRSEDGLWRWLKLFFLAGTVFLILFCNSRSAWIGLGLFALGKFYFRMDRREISAMAIGVLAFLVARYGFVDAAGIAATKEASGAERMMIYRASVQLLWHNPLGIEIGRYLSDVVPYLGLARDQVPESSFFDQPHSEFLKWGIQFGWLFLALALGALTLIAWRLLKAARAERGARQNVFLEFLLVLAPQLAFQFPFENPASLLVLAFVLGLYLTHFAETGRGLDISKAKIAAGALGLMGLINAFLYISALYLSSNYSRSPEMMRLMCDVYPVHFQSCYWEQLADLENKRPDRFRLHYREDMQKLPFYPDYMRLLPTYFQMTSETRQMCDAVKIYDYLYKGQKTFNEDLLNFCRPEKAPFNLTDTPHFRENYLRWLGQ